jgi:subfamily B ATP-binding cassette protein MsbA
VLQSGKTTALVGPSGSGKSTIMNLIPRFFDPSSGRIMIDGQDIREISLDSLRRHLAIVTQEIILFDDTIRANIAYSKPDASDEEIEEAAKAAAAHDFIMATEEGYDTIIGGDGMRLSGGQRQRIAIARAILRGAKILLLDEATSSLDNESERRVQEALNHLCEGRTTLLIAHRLSTIQNADMIIFLKNSRIIESGTHSELMQKGGEYAELIRKGEAI